MDPEERLREMVEERGERIRELEGELDEAQRRADDYADQRDMIAIDRKLADKRARDLMKELAELRAAVNKFLKATAHLGGKR